MTCGPGIWLCQSCLPSALHVDAWIGGYSRYLLYYCVASCGCRQSFWSVPTINMPLTSRKVFCCDSGSITSLSTSRGADSVWDYKSLRALIFSAAYDRHKAQMITKVELSDTWRQGERNALAQMHRKSLNKDVTGEEAAAWSFCMIPLERAARRY
jgi:hypothetical protein